MSPPPHDAAPATLPGTTRGARFLGWLERLKPVLDTLAFLGTVVGAVLTGREYFQNHHKERLEAAAQAYREVDDKFVDFMARCMDHPKLDCYGRPPTDGVGLSDDDRVQQQRLDTVLIDLLEFAYRRYVLQPGFQKEYFGRLPIDHEARDHEWGGWVVRTKTAVHRGHFRETWCSIHHEYSREFREFIVNQMMDTNTPLCADAGAAAPISPSSKIP
jgi:hypothetical protein